MRDAIMKISAVGLALAVSAVLANPALAQRSAQPTPDEVAGARASYGRGEAEFQAGNYAASEAAFLQAYDFVPNPIVLIGVAQSRFRQGNLSGAVEYFQRYLTERPDAPDRAQWETRIREITAQPGTLVAASDPPGATISIDGVVTEEVTPAQISLPPGEHVVVLSLVGHLDARQIVEITYGDSHEHTVALTGVGQAGDGDPGMGVGGDVGGLGGEDGDDDDDDAGGMSTELWAVSGVAGVALVTGTVLGFLALSEQSEFDEMVGNPGVDAAAANAVADSGESFALLADISFGIAAAAAITGVVLYLGGGDEAEQDVANASGDTRVELTPIVAPTGGGVSARVQF